MIATSTLLMYGLMYLNTFQLDHVFFSETRLYMDLIMGATMAVVMLTFMWRMYSNWKINAAIYVGSVVLFAVALWLVRSQQTVDDVSYMRAMIPHHSIAILTSKRAQITDPRVRKLADQIIASQQREIVEMKTLIEEIEAGGGQSTSSKNTNELVLGDRVPSPDAAAVKVPEGFRAEVVVSGLTYPTSVEFDDNGLMYIAEAGYSYGDSTAEPRILRVSLDGKVEAVVQGESIRGPVNDLLWHDDQMFVSHRGKISVLEDGGNIRDLVTGLPSDGDHHNNQMTVGPDGKIYFGQGTATNSGVVGVDNYKMGWLQDHPSFHDMPARDVKLVGRAHETPNPLAGEPAPRRINQRRAKTPDGCSLQPRWSSLVHRRLRLHGGERQTAAHSPHGSDLARGARSHQTGIPACEPVPARGRTLRSSIARNVAARLLANASRASFPWGLFRSDLDPRSA